MAVTLDGTEIDKYHFPQSIWNSDNGADNLTIRKD